MRGNISLSIFFGPLSSSCIEFIGVILILLGYLSVPNTIIEVWIAHESYNLLDHLHHSDSWQPFFMQNRTEEIIAVGAKVGMIDLRKEFALRRMKRIIVWELYVE